MSIAAETFWVSAGIACYGLSTGIAWLNAGTAARARTRWIAGSLALGVLALAVAIALRWWHLGQGPFMTMYEVLLSNLFSLGLIYLVSYWRAPLVRPSAIIALPLLVVLGLWLLTVPADAVPLPPTFENYWLWVHVLNGKIFLGTCLVAVALSGFLLLRRQWPGARWLSSLAEAQQLDTTVWRFMAIAFVFQSLMLLAGAVWAHDAWGRYWAWDPLETWAFVTWLALGLVLHLRVTFRVPPWSGWSMVIGVFVLAFLTFFGVPFISLAPHKGVM